MRSFTTADDRKAHAALIWAMKRIMFERDINQLQLAQAAGMQASTISRRMTNQSYFSVPELIRFCSVTGCHISDLFPKGETTGQPKVKQHKVA